MDVDGMVTPREAEKSDSNVNRGTVGQMMVQDKTVGILRGARKGK